MKLAGQTGSASVAHLRQGCVTPHIAQKACYSAIDRHTTRQRAWSLKQNKRIEEAFSWAKTVGGMTQTVYRGLERVRSRFIVTMATNNFASPSVCSLHEAEIGRWRASPAPAGMTSGKLTQIKETVPDQGLCSQPARADSFGIP
ncbi:hypothetical protein FHW03_004263 [Ochrobactrum sp. RH2CCR150]|nr:hypothetical protein [Ochrobactrum sp. RH2CCR150]